MSILLFISFFLNAFVSALIGLGGGTFYLAFLDLFNVNYIVIPFIALSCNILVSGIASITRLIRGQRANFVFLACILLPSIISTYVGAQFRIEEKNFKLFLSTAVFVILCFSLISKKNIQLPSIHKNPIKEYFDIKKTVILCFVSLCIGLLSGIIGIGGGIILGPVLYFMGMSYVKIPLITAIYIFINSCIGIFSQFIKFVSVFNSNIQIYENIGVTQYFFNLLTPYVPLLVICIISGSISMRFQKILKHEKFIKRSVFCVIMSIAVYNLIRAGVNYV